MSKVARCASSSDPPQSVDAHDLHELISLDLLSGSTQKPQLGRYTLSHTFPGDLGNTSVGEEEVKPALFFLSLLDDCFNCFRRRGVGFDGRELCMSVFLTLMQIKTYLGFWERLGERLGERFQLFVNKVKKVEVLCALSSEELGCCCLPSERDLELGRYPRQFLVLVRHR